MIIQDIITIVSRVLEIGPNTIDKNTNILEFGDSLSQVEIIIELEKHFKIEIPDSEIEKLTTINKIYKYIKGTIKK
ncbi:MAG TPA: acyl carrier protein [Alphaproteobacteria bacterium]|nr:acyl carrier protein [Alphaproteobacteria bacterium]